MHLHTKLLSSGAILALAVMAVPAAHAEVAYDFDLPAQPLANSLTAVGFKAHTNVAFTPEDVAGKQAPVLHGTYSADAALAALLQGSGLTVARTAGGSFVISAAAATAQPASIEPAPSASPTEVVVTGSRVIRNGNNSPTPTTVVSTETLMQAEPNTVYEALNLLPQLNNSQGVNAVAGGGNQNQAENTPNLRNLNISGVSRTLVLWDGHRVPPTDPQFMTVDETMIPQMLLKRVDVVTGGVSAVYGSDAVAGVVNFVTDTKFNGLKMTVQGGEADRDSLDQTVDVGVAFGKSFADGRGHFEGSLEYFNDPGVLYDRMKFPWAAELNSVQGNGTTIPYQAFSNSRTSQYTFGGIITSGVLAGQEFAQNGVLSPFVNGAPTTAGSPVQVGGDGGYNALTSLKSALRTQQAFGRVDYDFSDDVHGYAQLSVTANKNENVQTNNTFSETFSATNPYLAPTYQAELAAAHQSTFQLSEMPLEMGPTTPSSMDSNYIAMFGLDGSFGAGYKWELSGTLSESKQDTTQKYNANATYLAASLDAVVNPSNGKIVCAVALSNPSMYGNCVPLDLFGPSAANQAAINYIVHPTEYWSTVTMSDISGSVSGAPITDWAGPVNMAVSFEWRKTGLKIASDSQPTDTPNCASLPQDTVTLANCNASGVLWLSGSMAAQPQVYQTVSEVAYEADVPLLKDVPFAKALNLNAAARYTDYSTSGDVWSWKVGLDWQVNDQLTVRATRSQDIRAPNLTELYSANSLGLTNQLDYLTGQIATQVPRITGSNPNLVPEIAQNSTAGIVYRPDWLERGSLAIDVFDIRINNAIAQIDGSTQAVQDACIASGGSSPYCALIARPLGATNASAANTATAFYVEPINIAQVRTYGADVEANYATSVFDRPLTLRVLGTYQPHLTENTPGLSKMDLAGAQPTPVGRVTGFATYNPSKKFSVTVTEQWRSAMAWDPDRSLNIAMPKIPSVAYTDLNLSYKITRGTVQTEFYFNIQDLFNPKPLFGGALGTAGSPGGLPWTGTVPGDDVLGRFYTMGVHIRM